MESKFTNLVRSGLAVNLWEETRAWADLRIQVFPMLLFLSLAKNYVLSGNVMKSRVFICDVPNYVQLEAEHRILVR